MRFQIPNVSKGKGEETKGKIIPGLEADSLSIDSPEYHDNGALTASDHDQPFPDH